jgi:hypothetical protein
VDFRARLVATLRAVEPVLAEEGVLVLGSQVPNLLQPGSASTLVVSQDVDIGVPVGAHAAVKVRLRSVRDLTPSKDEPSVWVPRRPDLIEVNFIGFDPALTDLTETYVLEDPELPLMVFGPLSLVQQGARASIDGVSVPLPRPAGLALEKLITDRSGEKGARDLLVVAGLFEFMTPADVEELERAYRTLPSDLRHAARSNLTVLSLMAPHAGMPDPRPRRAMIAALLDRLEQGES